MAKKLWVRFPSPAPKREVIPFGMTSFFIVRMGIEQVGSNPNGLRKKTVRWTVFADVATSDSSAIGALRRKIPITRSKKRSCTFWYDFFFYCTMGIEQGGSEILYLYTPYCRFVNDVLQNSD